MIDHSPLGQSSSYPEQYDPAILFGIPRNLARSQLGLVAGEELPFTGVDIWNAYELSWLNQNGMPVVRMLTMEVPAWSPCIVESKSLKLYLGSLNQHVFENEQALIQCLEQDLSQTIEAPVKLTLSKSIPGQLQPEDFVCLDQLQVKPNLTWTPEQALQQLQEVMQRQSAKGDDLVSQSYYSDLFRSLCPVTSQPDWAQVQIKCEGLQCCQESLLNYILSFRQHEGFHEHCVESMFLQLSSLGIKDLSIYARFTRRGGIDINPFRSATWKEAPENQLAFRQ